MSRTGEWLVSTLLAGILLAGVLGVGLLDYPGASQNYFWQNAQPVFAIALCWAGALLADSYGKALIAVAFSIFCATWLLWSLTQRLTVVGIGIVVMALAGTALLAWLNRGSSASLVERPRVAQALLLVACAAVLIQSAQLVSIPTGTAGGMASDSQDPAAIHSSQLAAFEFIRSHSVPDDIVLTNKHCLSGSTELRDCDAR
jgi:hypothetical protein